MALRIKESVDSGEHSHGATAGRRNSGRPAATGPLDAPEPLDQDLRAQNRTYPFAALFHKDPLVNLEIDPQSMVP